ncbi:MAG: FAD-binding oxidoreductase [Hyphomicrobiaceae bacterium]
MSAQTELPRSWYRAMLPEEAPRAPLSGDVETEVCVIGAGLAGLTTAHELVRRGRNVVLIEANRIAWGASGRNGGFVSAGYAEGIEAIVARAGRDAAVALHALSAEGVEHVRGLVRRIAPASLGGPGWVSVMRHPAAAELERHRDRMDRDFGRVLEYWPSERTRAVLKSRRYYEALLDPAAFHIQPLAYARALARDGEAMGLALHEGTPATRLARKGAAHVVSAPEGSITARHVVLAVSAYGRGLSRALDRTVLPVATYVGVTEPLGELAGAAIATPAAISDDRRAGDYYRLVDGSRILWGGRITTRVSEPRRLAQMMRRDMLSVYPQLGLPRMDFAWAGLMGYARHKMPVIGREAEGLWHATAFGGHGLNTTAMAGLVIARAIDEGDDAFRRFAPFGPTWGGGPFGRLGVQLSYWGMQIQDRIDEARAMRRQRRLSRPSAAR